MSQEFVVRRATPEDARAIVAQRRLMFQSMGHTDPDRLDAMAEKFLPWVKERLASGEYLGWLVVNERGKAVAGAGLWIREWVINPADLSGQVAHALNVYTYPAYRRRGFARQLMETMLVWCRANGINGVELRPTEHSRTLYESLGFEADDVMAQRLVEK